MISIPTRGSVSWEFFATFSELKKPPGTHININPKVFSIDITRNDDAEKFMVHPEFTHHLWIDDDIVLLRPDSIYRLISHNLPIVTGLYFRNDWPHHPIIMSEHKLDDTFMFEFPYADKPYPKNTLVRCEAGGMGLCLVKREVYEKIPKPWFKFNAEGQQAGEDIYFFRKAREAGFHIFVDTGVEALHIVKDAVGPDDLRWEWYKRRHPIDGQKLKKIRDFLERKKVLPPRITLAKGGHA